MVKAPSVRHPGELRWETNLLAVVTLTLTGFGVINCYGTGTYLPDWEKEASQQLSGAVVGGIAFLVCAYLDYGIWRRVAKPMFYATLVGLALLAIVATLWPKHAPGVLRDLFPYRLGAHRWIYLGVQVQVSEIARFTLAAYIAMRCADLGQKIRRFSDGFVPVMGLVVVTVGLVAAEPSISMSIVLGLIGASIIFTAGAKLQHIIPTGVVGMLAVVAVLKWDEVRNARVEQAAIPALQCIAKDDQSCSSLVGLGSGGITGAGFGEGTQKLGHLPLAYSDFLFSVIGEEWGFVGSSFVIGLFALFCWLGFRIARTARDSFGTYFATGLTAAVGATALFHIAVVLRMGPTTGLTLPFMSAGRASIILYLLSAGVIVNIGRRRGRPARSR
jgi:cell division protein FtsW